MAASRIGLLVLVALMAAQARAQADNEPTGLWVAEYENDLFAGADRYYTSGIRLTRVGQTRTPPSWLESVARRFPGFDNAETLPYSLSISHNIFTPADIENPEFPPDDRLYAGWLNVEFKTGTLQPRGADRIRVGLGIAGPAAGGKQLQNFIHELIDTRDPVGWEEQLENEPTILLGYDRLRRITPMPTPSGRRFYASYFGGITLGNAYTHISAGGFMRWGDGLQADYGPPRITPAVSGSAFFKPGGLTRCSFLGTAGRAADGDALNEKIATDGREGVDA